MLGNISTQQLIEELVKRKEVQLFDCGLYQQWQLIGRYSNRQIELPKEYQVLLLRPSNLTYKS